MRALERRQFLKISATSLFGSLMTKLAAPLTWAEDFYREPPWRRKKPYWGFAIDIDKCIGCAKCVEACKTENDVPKEPFYFRTWVERYVLRKNGEVEISCPNGGLDGYPAIEQGGAYGEVAKAFFVPKLCNGCENSPCVQVCPVGATFKTEDGVVLIDKDYCIGCRYCIQACPYGTRFFNPFTQTADKCSMCYHRITKGLNPACVEVCPTGTRIFGDLSDPNSELTKFREVNKTESLKVHMGTEPKLVYKGYDKDIR